MAGKDGKILAVGAEADVLNTVGENTQKIDLDGKTMLPGFVDSHGHAYLSVLINALNNARTSTAEAFIE